MKLLILLNNALQHATWKTHIGQILLAMTILITRGDQVHQCTNIPTTMQMRQPLVITQLITTVELMHGGVNYVLITGGMTPREREIVRGRERGKGDGKISTLMYFFTESVHIHNITLYVFENSRTDGVYTTHT